MPVIINGTDSNVTGSNHSIPGEQFGYRILVTDMLSTVWSVDELAPQKCSLDGLNCWICALNED
jgi:hypothetical protein